MEMQQTNSEEITGILQYNPQPSLESKFRESKVKYGKLSDMVWSMVHSNPYYPKLNKDYYLPLPYLTYDRDRSLTCQAKKVRKPGYLNCFQAEITLRKILPGS